VQATILVSVLGSFADVRVGIVVRRPVLTSTSDFEIILVGNCNADFPDEHYCRQRLTDRTDLCVQALC
jgi:hypothetical protein